MGELDFYDTCGYISGFLFASSLVPQLYKSCKIKQLDDISYYWQFTFLSGMSLMLWKRFKTCICPRFI